VVIPKKIYSAQTRTTVDETVAEAKAKTTHVVGVAATMTMMTIDQIALAERTTAIDVGETSHAADGTATRRVSMMIVTGGGGRTRTRIASAMRAQRR